MHVEIVYKNGARASALLFGNKVTSTILRDVMEGGSEKIIWASQTMHEKLAQTCPGCYNEDQI